MGFKLDSFLVYVMGTVVTIIGFVLFLIGVENSLITFGELVGKKMIEKGKIMVYFRICSCYWIRLQ